MLYKIGMMSKLLGISIEGLRLYERRGMINAIKDEETGVRYYEPLDITSLIRCRSYRKYGFTMDETADLMNTKDLNFVIDQYKNREEEIEKRIQWDKQMLSYLKSIRAVVESIETDYEKCVISTSPAMYRFVYMKNGELVLNDVTMKKFSNWMERVPFSALSIIWDKELFIRGETSYEAALCVPEEYAKAVGHYLGEPVQYIPARKCIYTLSSEDANKFDTEYCMKFAIDYIREKGYTLTEDPFCRTFLSTDKKGNYTRWRQVWLPIE